MYDLLEKCREKLNSTFSYIISIFGDGLKKRVIYHLQLWFIWMDKDGKQTVVGEWDNGTLTYTGCN